jgi:hypothetical protein
MAAYVLHHDNDGKHQNYHFTGPFASVRQAALWADAGFANEWWFVLELENDPATEAPLIQAPVGPRVAVERPPYVYALCWSNAEFHMVGPFGSTDALERYIQIACDSDRKRPDDDRCNSFGPHGDDLRWYAVELQAPAGPSRVDPAPPASEVPTKPTRKRGTRHMRMCHRVAFMTEIMERAADTHPTQTRRN